jgi:hypothetical protein
MYNKLLEVRKMRRLLWMVKKIKNPGTTLKD